MIKKIAVILLCALILALGLASIHAHLPREAMALSFIDSTTATSSVSCHLCWAQANFNSDDKPVSQPTRIIFPAFILALGTEAAPLSASFDFSLSPRAPPLA